MQVRIPSLELGTNVRRRLTTLAVAATVGALALTGVVSAGATVAAQKPNAGGYKIGLLLPENQTTRYEAFDHPVFVARIHALCPTCTVDYKNAAQNEATQLTQFNAAIANGDQVIVLDPVNGATAATMVAKAKSAGVKVISYDRLVTGTTGLSLYISFDNQKVGVLQATALVARMKALHKTKGNIVVINGSVTDNNAHLFNAGALSVLKKNPQYKIVGQHWTLNWTPADAQTFMQGQIAKFGKNAFVGVYAANDGTAGGAIAAMQKAGYKPIPPITGQDAQLTNIQYILNGLQYMTVYKALIPEATQAANAAYTLASGGTVKTTVKVSGVPSILLTPIAVTQKNIEATVVKDKFYTAKQICTKAYAAACKKYGVK